MPRQDLIQVRRDTAANWTSINPVLAAGEIGYETNTRQVKIGDGLTNWNTLPYTNTNTNGAAYSVLGRAGATSGPTSDIVASSTGLVLQRGDSGIEFGQIKNAGISNSSIDSNKLASSSVTSPKLSTATSGTTGDYLTRNTGVTSGFEWTTFAYPSWTSYTPTWTQSATITKTVNWARYIQIGKLVIGSVQMTATSVGTNNNAIVIGIPVTASTNNYIMGQLLVKSGSVLATGVAVYDTQSTLKFYPYGSSYNIEDGFWGLSGGSPTGKTVANNDIFRVQFSYEAA